MCSNFASGRGVIDPIFQCARMEGDARSSVATVVAAGARAASRAAAGPKSRVPRARAALAKGLIAHPAMGFVRQADCPLADLAQSLLALPSSVQKLLRLVRVGHGSRHRECSLCLCSSSSPDPVLGTEVLFLWGHIDSDNMPVMGLICFLLQGRLAQEVDRLVASRSQRPTPAGE